MCEGGVVCEGGVRWDGGVLCEEGELRRGGEVCEASVGWLGGVRCKLIGGPGVWVYSIFCIFNGLGFGVSCSSSGRFTVMISGLGGPVCVCAWRYVVQRVTAGTYFSDGT